MPETCWPAPPLPARWTGAAGPRFVGRRRELALLADAVAATARGARQVVLVGGEPGAGKSRLLAEACRCAAGEGAAVLLGTCVEELGAPYQPLVEPLEELASAFAAGALPAGDDVLQRLRTLLGRREEDDERAPAHRRELHEAAVEAVAAAAAQRPLVLALEDVHWASPAALRLLAHLVDRTAGCRLLVLVTSRTTAPDRSPDLVTALAHLARLEGASRIDLPGLDPDDVAAYLVGEGGVAPEAARGAAGPLHAQTGGNPFFLRELWRDLAAHGGLGALHPGLAVPASVRDTLESRLLRLPAPHRQVLEIAAVLGEDVELSVLLAAAEWSADTVLDALDAARSTGLLEPVEPGARSAADRPADVAFRFPHDLARSAVLDLMAPARLAREHARVAAALERGPRDDRRVRRLAHHYSAAAPLGYAERAVACLVEAADAAGRSLAHGEAARCLEQAAALEASGERRADLLLAAARAHLLDGDFARARALDEQVAATGTPEQRLRAAIGHEAASWRPGLPGHRSAELLVTARRDLDLAADDPLHVRTLASLGRALAFTGRADEARALGRRAVELARTAGDDALLAHALQASLWWGLRPEEAPAKLAIAGELSGLAERSGWLGHLGPAAYFRAVVCYLQGEPSGLAAGHRDLARTTHATGQGFFQYMAGCVDYALQFVAGRFGEARETCESLLALGASFGTDDTEGPYGVQVFLVERETGGLERVRPLVTGEEDPTERWAPGLLALWTELGYDAPAARLLHDLLDDLDRYERSAAWPGVLAFLTEAALHLGDAAAAARLRPLLEEYAGLNLVAGQFVGVFGAADRYRGAVDALLGVGDPEEVLAAALALDRRMAAPVHEAHTWAALAAARRSAGASPSAVAEAERAARALAERLGLPRVLRVLPAGPAPAVPAPRLALLTERAAPAAGPAAPDGLTDREVEVLRLVGEGLKNRQIAQRLVISEHTAANHVRSILAKTGSGNRTQAARYAARHGLL